MSQLELPLAISDPRFAHYPWCCYHAGGDTHVVCPMCQLAPKGGK